MFGLQVRVCVDLVHVNCENMETGCVEKQLLEESLFLNSQAKDDQEEIKKRAIIHVYCNA